MVLRSLPSHGLGNRMARARCAPEKRPDRVELCRAQRPPPLSPSTVRSSVRECSLSVVQALDDVLGNISQRCCSFSSSASEQAFISFCSSVDSDTVFFLLYLVRQGT